MNLSYIQRIEIDLSVVHTDERFTVNARQVFYDLGQMPEINGYLTVKINNIQSGSMSLTPGSDISHNNIQEIFITNNAQPGKKAALLLSFDAKISANPSNALSVVPRKTVDFTRTQEATFTSDFGIGGTFSNDIILSSSNTNGILVHFLTLSVRCADYRDLVYITTSNAGPGTVLNGITTCGRDQLMRVEDIYLPPLIGLRLQSFSSLGGVPQVSYNGTLAVDCRAVFTRL